MFGSFDGLVTAVGLVFAAVITAADVFALSLALAVSAGVSMAAGEWLADDATDGRNTRRAVVMGASTFVASVLPAVGYAFTNSTAALIVAVVVTIGIGCAIAEIRPGARLPSYVKTFGVLAVACGLACLAALLGQVIATS